MIKTNRPVGDRINEFDNLDVQTVATFNALFPECPIKRYAPDDYVTIGAILSGDRRELFIGYHDSYEEHKMYRDTLYGVDRDQFYGTENEEPLDEIYGHPV